ncbi:type VI secretion system tip protein VgrG [Candidatus Methylospira mobilis]|uniref:Type VI secretion system tip protein VgrG n=1 Tax=Candidatus Methylospira mobilis TaxID=1808979 RepID=A0A5Q0BMB3_9GAMM|nr:type VI secretion system tip protein TssI/VgrG [Candidatus Methylospira mobilis]QFY42876.1 type VI secretion system tip protein VgrG [Candidatus Methylospira mobilis]WNV04065.1 type VI secretion system tip protein TssI/VgrG [Candidatus Methylospira mobilis]
MNASGQLSGSNRRFTFSCANLANTSFEVVRFEGEEALSSLYRFELLLAVADHGDLDESRIIGRPALFTLNDGVAGGMTTAYHGLVQDFSYAYQATTGWTIYRAVLVPKMWRLTAYHLSEVYLNKNPNEIFKLILDNAGFSSNDFEWRLPRDRQSFLINYICQYQESYYEFIERWADRLGDYWWYEENEGSEKIVFTHSLMAHKNEALQLHYLPIGNHAGANEIRRLQSLECETRCLPERVTVMDYFHEKSSLGIKATQTVDPEGIGEVFLYGQNLRSNEVASKVAQLHAETLRCRAKQYSGSSDATGLRCGHLLEVTGHPRSSFNRRYLLTRVRHCGSQAIALLELGLTVPASAQEKTASVDFYRADINAIPSDVQFRSEMRRPWPKIEGTLTAFIDAEGDGEYAELNESGEYKVQMPFVVTDKYAGKCSAWIRKSSEYAGFGGQGMHFPLRKGAEVLLSFINGDPDQPVIIGAVPNSVAGNVVNNDNRTQSKLQSSAGNYIIMEDKALLANLFMGSPMFASSLTLGAPLGICANTAGLISLASAGNVLIDTASAVDIKAAVGIKLSAPTDITLSSAGPVITTAASKTELFLGEEFQLVGDTNKIIRGQSNTVTIGNKLDLAASVKFDINASSSTTMTVGTKLDTFLGAKFEWTTAAAFKMTTGVTFDNKLGPNIENKYVNFKNTAMAVKKEDVEVNVKEVVVDSVQAQIQSLEAQIQEVTTELLDAQCRISSLEFELQESSMSMRSSTTVINRGTFTMNDGIQMNM